MSAAQAAFQIRRALASDAHAIYALKVQAFGNNYLLYTIYQAPQSVYYLQELIVQGAEQSRQYFVVASRDDQILGYYHAVRADEYFFLNYVVVTSVARGQGLGDALMEHYEEAGRACGGRQWALDVFDSNSRVRDWYLRHGYQQQSESFHVRLKTKSFASASSPPMAIDNEAWSRAVAEEQSRGFSKITGMCGVGRLTIGLIAGRMCKLLAYEEVTLDEAVRAVSCQFSQERDVLVISFLPDVPVIWPVLGYEKVLRLSKPIR